MRGGKRFFYSHPGISWSVLAGFALWAVLASAQPPSVPVPPGAQPAASGAPTVGPPSPGAQAPAPPAPGLSTRPADIPVIKADTRLVLIDVVVRGKNDLPVRGLKAGDFTLVEDGKPQQIKFFDEHTTPAQAAGAAPARPRVLPPNQYTNVPEGDSGAALTVILLDTLNTPMLDQAYGRQQLLKFLATMPRGQKAALFTLGSRLRVVQGFTGNTDELVAAANRLSSKPSPLLTSENETQTTEDSTTRMENELGPFGAQAAENLRQGLADVEALRTDQRVAITLEALVQLSRSLSGYAGRKNLLWLSGGFPFGLGADLNLTDPMRNLRNYAPAVRETSGQLAAAQVAVYPIDIRGLVTTGVDISSSGLGSTGFSRRGGSRYGALLDRQSQGLNNDHATMNEIAEETGGEAFYNTNGLATAMNKTIQQTSTYYTLAYIPGNRDWNGKFRKVMIKLDRRDARLDYRRGYFGSPEQHLTPNDSQRLLAGALQRGTPDATSLFFLVRVSPPDASRKTVQINFSIDPRHLTLTDLPTGRKHALVELMGIAWDKNGRDGGHFSGTLDANLTPATFARVMQGGLPARQELDLKPGSYHLRVGVMDRSNQNLGTIDVPLTVP